MPELPEAEYMTRMLAGTAAPPVRIVTAAVLRKQSVAPMRAREFEDALTGRRIRGYSRRAKNVLIHLDRSQTLRIQLGMSGHVYWVRDALAPPPRFTRVLFDLGRRAGAIVFEDARVFGRVHLHRDADLPGVFASYGPEPLDARFTWRDLREAAHGLRGIAIKPFLLDQSRVAGLGNIWAAEACFAARVSPFRAVSALTGPEWRLLHSAIRRVLGRAIADTFKVTRLPEEFPEAGLLTCAVYGREGEPCRRCRLAVIERRTQAARSTFFCPRCQPGPL